MLESPSFNMAKPRCVVLDGWTLTERVPGAAGPPEEPAWDALEQLVQLTVFPRTDPATVLERAKNAELLLTNKVVLDETTLAELSELHYVGVLATGTNVLDLQAAKRRNVIVTNVPGYATESVVAHVFALILELEMRVSEHARFVRDGAWCRATDFTFRLGATQELAELTLGIVGFGNIGQRVAAVAQAFGMRTLAATRPGGARTVPPLGQVELRSIDALFAEADVISLHCPLTPDTEKLVNARTLGLMKPNAILINTGRGSLIDEPALAEALARGRLRGAGLDVLSQEPPASDHPLLQAPNCLITPHLAWATTGARCRLMRSVTNNVAAYLAGNPTNRVA